MKVFIKKIGLIIVVSLLTVMIVSKMCLWSLKQSAFYKPAFVSNALDKEDYDYIVLGSSTGLTTINTVQIDAILGSHGINLSMDDTGLSSHYVMLQHFLAEGKTTKYCIISPSNAAYNVATNKLSTNDYRFLTHIDKDYIYKYYKRFNTSEADILSLSKWLPFVGVLYYNTELFYPSLISVVLPGRRNRFDTYGNYTYPNLDRANVEIGDKSGMSLNFSNPYLNKIAELCSRNDIQLICYISPMETKSVQINPKKDYMVINHSDLLRDEALFYDEIHVNTKGREICSGTLANDLKVLISDARR